MSNDDQTTITKESLTQSVITMAVESWRIGRVFERMLTRLDAGEQARYESQFRWFLKKVEDSLKEAGLRFVNVQGQPFEPGLPVTPLNIEEFGAEDILVVDQMLEPIIMGPQGLVRTGTATLKRGEA